MPKSNIVKSLNELKMEDVYSLLLFALSELKDVPEYKTISELCYIVDKNSLLNLFKYYGGMTITIPKVDDFKLILNTLIFYELLNVEHLSYSEALSQIDLNEVSEEELKTCLSKISIILDKFDFKRG